MKVTATNIIPITEARSNLGNLTEEVQGQGENYIILTKGGNPKAALVDISYLEKLQEEVAKIYRKTFIDPKLLPLTREFSEKEVNQWQEEDAL